MSDKQLAEVIETYSDAVGGLKEFQNMVKEIELNNFIDFPKTRVILKHIPRLLGQLQITIYHYLEYKKLSSYIVYLLENVDFIDIEDFRRGRVLLEEGQLYPKELNNFTVLKYNFMKNSYAYSYENSVGFSCDITIKVANLFYHSWSSIHSILKFHARYLGKDSKIMEWKAIKKVLLDECKQKKIKLHYEILNFVFDDKLDPKNWLMSLRALRDELAHCKRLDNGFRNISNGDIFNGSQIIFSPDSRSGTEDLNEIELTSLIRQLELQYDSFFLNSLKHYGDMEFQKDVWKSYLS